MWFTDNSKKTHGEKGHGIDVGVANRIHLKEPPHSNLSFPLLLSPMTLGTPEQGKSLPHCAGPSSMVLLGQGLPQTFTALHPVRHCPALTAPIYSLGVLQQGAFHRDRAQRDGFCFKKEKKEQETNALFVRFLCSYCCNSQQL